MATRSASARIGQSAPTSTYSQLRHYCLTPSSWHSSAMLIVKRLRGRGKGMVSQSAPLCEYVELSSDHLCSASSQLISWQLTYFCPDRPSFVTARVRSAGALIELGLASNHPCLSRCSGHAGRAGVDRVREEHGRLAPRRTSRDSVIVRQSEFDHSRHFCGRNEADGGISLSSEMEGLASAEHGKEGKMQYSERKRGETLTH